MEKFYNAVSGAGFSSEIIQTLKEIVDETDDLQLLNAGDIGKMFPKIEIKKRKALWKCISQQQESNAQQEKLHQSRGGTVSQTGDGSMSMGAGNYAPHAQLAGTINNGPRDSNNLNITVRDVTGSSVAGGNVTNTSSKPRRKKEMPQCKRRAEETETDNDHNKRMKPNNDPRQKAKQTKAEESRNMNINVEQATGSSIAGGNITNTTHNTTKEKSKFNISMTNAKGVVVGDHSTVHGNHFKD